VTDLGGQRSSSWKDSAVGEGNDVDPDSEWDGDESWWSDELHIPYVPPRTVEDEQWDEPPPAPTRQDLRYRPAPAGSSRRERKEWWQAEGERIADLLATVERPRKAGLRVSAPRGLGWRGRKAFYATRSENVQARRRRTAGNLSERELGILALVVVIAIALLVRVLFFDPEPTTAQSTGESSAASPTAAPIGTAPEAGPGSNPAGSSILVDPAAVAAGRAWFTLTCGLPPAEWAPARPLMTDAGWAAVEQTPLVVHATWTCANLTVRADPEQTTPQVAVIRMDADRTVSTGTSPVTTEHVSETRLVIDQGQGSWLVDEPAKGGQDH
jgi:hypothetical protein